MKNSKHSKRKSPSTKRNTLDKPERESLEALLARLDITDWDIIIVGDGSGSNWTQEAGWAAVSIERLTMERLVWTGAMSRGTVNFAEIMAYLQPLNWLVAREEERRKTVRTRAYRVHILTDSSYCAQTGSSDNRLLKKNASLWAAFDVFARAGFSVQWHWIPRESCALNRYCDNLSRMARIATKKRNLAERVERTDGISVYDVNPSEKGD